MILVVSGAVLVRVRCMLVKVLVGVLVNVVYDSYIGGVFGMIVILCSTIVLSVVVGLKRCISMMVLLIVRVWFRVMLSSNMWCRGSM